MFGIHFASFHAFSDFHEAFLALALFAAGCGHLDAQRLGAIKQRRANRGIAVLEVEM